MAQMIQCLAFVLLTIKSLSQGQSLAASSVNIFPGGGVVVVMIVTALVQVSASVVLLAVLSVVRLEVFLLMLSADTTPDGNEPACLEAVSPACRRSPSAWRQASSSSAGDQTCQWSFTGSTGYNPKPYTLTNVSTACAIDPEPREEVGQIIFTGGWLWPN